MKWALALPLIVVICLSVTDAAPLKSKVTRARPTTKPVAGHPSTHVSTGSASAPKAGTRTRVQAKSGSSRGVRLVAVRRGPSDAGMSRSARSGRAARGGRYVKVAAASYQSHPDPERYQEIQKALADKGYFKGEQNGTWGADSGDALKRFQADQKLTDDGKITAPTLSGLGLGPKHGPSDRVGSSPLVPVVEPPAAPESVPPPTPEPQSSRGASSLPIPTNQ